MSITTGEFLVTGGIGNALTPFTGLPAGTYVNVTTVAGKSAGGGVGAPFGGPGS